MREFMKSLIREAARFFARFGKKTIDRTVEVLRDPTVQEFIIRAVRYGFRLLSRRGGGQVVPLIA